MRRAVTIASVASIPVDVQASWVPVFLFVTWSLADGFFPRLDPGDSAALYWLVGSSASLLLFLCLLAHEFGHALVARQRGLTVYRVSLFFLGGVVEIDVDGGSATDELLMAGAGPIVSVLLGALFGGAWWSLNGADRLLAAINLYLALSNVLLAAFNLLPGFPLDGGRILRAALWYRLGDHARATRMAGFLGLVLGLVGVGAGAGLCLGGQIAPILALWIIAVGAFVAFAALTTHSGSSQ